MSNDFIMSGDFSLEQLENILKFFMLFMVIVVFIWIAVMVLSYIFMSIGISRIAKAKGYKDEWLSFVPVFQLFIFNRYMNDKVEKPDYAKRRLNHILLGIPLLIYVGNFILGFIIGILETVIGTFGILFSVLNVLNMFIWLVWYIFVVYIMNQLFKRYTNKNILLVIIMILFGFLGFAIAVFSISKGVVREINSENERREEDILGNEEDLSFLDNYDLGEDDESIE